MRSASTHRQIQAVAVLNSLGSSVVPTYIDENQTHLLTHANGYKLEFYAPLSQFQFIALAPLTRNNNTLRFVTVM